MITVTTTYVRPAVEVKFYLDSAPTVAAAFQQVMIDSSHSPVYSYEYSGDMLTFTSVAEYGNQTELDGFLADLDAALPTFFADRDAYCSANSISITRQQV
jgi:hypothetical protein